MEIDETKLAEEVRKKAQMTGEEAVRELRVDQFLRRAGYPADLPKLLDLLGRSGPLLIVVTFLKSTSRSYSEAVSFAKRASIYQESGNNREILHIVGFGKTHAQAACALSLLELVEKWHSMQVYAGGAYLQKASVAREVLRCYVKSKANSDYRAHCFVVIDDPILPSDDKNLLNWRNRINRPFNPTNVRYIFPCRHISFYFKVDRRHPSELIDQLKAEAIHRGCDWCPNFVAEDLRKTAD